MHTATSICTLFFVGCPGSVFQSLLWQYKQFVIIA